MIVWVSVVVVSHWSMGHFASEDDCCTYRLLQCQSLSTTVLFRATPAWSYVTLRRMLGEKLKQRHLCPDAAWFECHNVTNMHIFKVLGLLYSQKMIMLVRSLISLAYVAARLSYFMPSFFPVKCTRHCQQFSQIKNKETCTAMWQQAF